ncbi:MAG: YqgE/AlgH family protein [Burkholderiaceae bacterium]|nr:YqgE/AlgH family protein [Burkholderiaceae bacterium]
MLAARIPMELKHHFLIAMPNMVDPNFAGTVVYICEHNANTALGLVINRPTDLTLGYLFEKLELSVQSAPWKDEPVYFGGPVQTERGFVLHQPQGNYGSSLPVAEDIALTTSKDVLEALAEGKGPRRLLVTLGYAGWGAGQLENEIAQNAWLTVPADPAVIFDTPAQERLPAALRLLGIDDGTRLSGLAGHA